MIEKIKNVLKVVCKSCRNEVEVYPYSKRTISCEACTAVIAKPSGGKCNIV